MPKDKSARYDQEFIGRVRAARSQRFTTQSAIAEVLGMEQDKWKQYEVRSLLPHELVPRFCKACGVSIAWLLANEGPGPQWMPYVHEPRKRVPAAPTKRRKVA